MQCAGSSRQGRWSRGRPAVLAFPCLRALGHIRRMSRTAFHQHSSAEEKTMNSPATHPYIKWFADITIDDVPLVGGKNASLGEMVRELASKGVKVPDGFAITAEAYRHFIREAGTRRAHPRDARGPRYARHGKSEPARPRRAAGHSQRHAADRFAGVLSAKRIASCRAAAWCRWMSRCARLPPPKTCRMRALPGSRKRI